MPGRGAGDPETAREAALLHTLEHRFRDRLDQAPPSQARRAGLLTPQHVLLRNPEAKNRFAPRSGRNRRGWLEAGNDPAVGSDSVATGGDASTPRVPDAGRRAAVVVLAKEWGLEAAAGPILADIPGPERTGAEKRAHYRALRDRIATIESPVTRVRLVKALNSVVGAPEAETFRDVSMSGPGSALARFGPPR